jgi:hypothetical protein
VSQPPAADDHQPDHQPHPRDRTEVAPAGRPGTGGADRRIEPRGPQVLPEQLEPGVRGERDVREFQTMSRVCDLPMRRLSLSYRAARLKSSRPLAGRPLWSVPRVACSRHPATAETADCKHSLHM